MTILPAEKLSFKYLPAYADFLLKEKLEDFTKTSLKISREEKLPILKYLSAYSEEQLFEMGKTGAKDLLSNIAANETNLYIDRTIKLWKDNMLVVIDKDAIVAEDITYGAFVRRKLFKHFLKEYTVDKETTDNILEELDRFTSYTAICTYKVYLNIQQEKLNKTNSELLHREEQLNEAQELAEIGSFLWDMKDPKNSVYTPQTFKIFEMSESSNLENFLNYVHPDDRDLLKTAIDKALNHDGMYECEYRYLRNGKEKKIWSKGIVDFENGHPVKMKGNIMDVTKKHLLIEQLQESEKQHKKAQAITHLGNWVWDITENKLFWSDEMYRIYGLDHELEEITFEKYISLIHPENREKRMQEIQEALKTLKAPEYLLRIVTPDGVTKMLKGIGEVVAHEGRAVKLIGTCQDITKEYLSKLELQTKSLQLLELNNSLAHKNVELERINKELESFNYIASHDLQEPLRKIQIYSNRLVEKNTGHLPKESLEYIEKIKSSSMKMQNLIEDLLAFSQINSPSDAFEKVDLNAVLEEVKNVLADSIEEHHAIIESARLPLANVVPFQFAQLFINIISNAIKYKKESISPVIRISSSVINGKDSQIKELNPEYKYFKLSIADNGIGFEAEYNEKIFDLFKRLHNQDKYSGTGIGLSICKKIVHNHNGIIKAESEKEKGTAFHIYLPEERIINS